MVSTFVINVFYTTSQSFFYHSIHYQIGQFGVTKEKQVNSVTNDEVPTQSNEKVTKLTEQDAHDIAAVIKAAGEDPETIQMISKLKEDQAEALDELKQLPAEEILNGLKTTLDEMKLVEYLFQDKDRALEEMEKEGLIPEKHLKKYRQDPSLLEQDTKQAIYFRFVSLAVVGGYL